MNHALQRIGAGDSKGALSLLKRARSRGASLKRTAPLFYRAYEVRAEGLEARGMADQAKAARSMASKYAEAFASMVPSARDLVPLLKSLPDKDCFELYARYLRSNPPHRQAESGLADRVVLKRCWEHLGILAEDSRFRLDAAAMVSALGPLDRGDWGGGRRLLRSLGKDSAFRAWVVFCDAMDAYARNDTPELRQALRALPSTFPLQSSVKGLRIAVRSAASRASTVPRGVAGLLGVGRFEVPKRGQDLRASVRSNSPSRIARAIANFAHAIDPHDPSETQLQIALALELAVAKDELPYGTYLEILRHTGPPRGAEQRIQRAIVQTLGHPMPLVAGTAQIARLLANIHLLYPDPALQQIARSRILYKLGHAVSVVPPWQIEFEEFDGLGMIVGDMSFQTMDRYERDPLVAAADLLRMSVKADPSNTDAHKRLVEILRSSLTAKRSELVAAHEGYAKAVPEDPDPWIALAELRLRHNAYRKAQSALKKACRYASQDERVLDLLALSSVVAARRNIQSGGLLRAKLDLDAAESRMGPKSEPLVRAWRGLLLFKKRKHAKLQAACEQALAGCSPVVRAQALCLMLAACGMSHPGLKIPKREQRPLWQMIGPAVRAVCKECPHELPRLVGALPEPYESVTPTNAVALYMSGHWKEILRAVPDAVMFNVFLVALESREWGALRKELPRRLARARDRARGRLLMLYLATIRYLLGEDSGGQRFHRLKASIPQAEREPLRVAAEKLATAIRFSFVPHLGAALRSFEFTILDQDRGLF